jgi:hypothetical protein
MPEGIHAHSSPLSYDRRGGIGRIGKTPSTLDHMKAPALIIDFKEKLTNCATNLGESANE